MSLSRRALFGGLVTLAAPAVIRTPGLLMPIKAARYEYLTYEIGYAIVRGVEVPLSPEHRAALNRGLLESMQQTKWNVMAKVLRDAAC